MVVDHSSTECLSEETSGARCASQTSEQPEDMRDTQNSASSSKLGLATSDPSLHARIDQLAMHDPCAMAEHARARTKQVKRLQGKVKRLKSKVDQLKDDLKLAAEDKDMQSIMEQAFQHCTGNQGKLKAELVTTLLKLELGSLGVGDDDKVDEVAALAEQICEAILNQCLKLAGEGTQV